MIGAVTILLVFQLAGEAAARAAGLPLPGPVVGMAAALAVFALWPRARAAAQPAADGILAKLGLLFVPAGVGVTGHLGLLGWDAAPLFAALALSTFAAIVTGAWVFERVARWTGTVEDD